MALAHDVFAKIDAMWDEEVSFLQGLGKFPSVLGNEGPIQRFMSEYFRSMNLRTDVFVPDVQSIATHPGFSAPEWTYEGRPVVVAQLPAGGGEPLGRSLILQGHVDVVSPEPVRLWDYDPWGSTIDGDRMIGRGICDMKSGVTAMIFAVKAIMACGINLGADVLLQSVLEEECTGNGALATLHRGYRADGAIIPEAFGLSALTAQVGVIWMRVRVTGAGSHVERADRSVNAIDKAYRLIRALEQYQVTINERVKHADFEKVVHPLNVNIGTIHSGDWPSTVPSECTFEARIGFYPDVNPQTVKDEVQDWLMNEARRDSWLAQVPPEITFYGFHAHGVSLDRNLPIFATLAQAHKLAHGRDMEYSVSTATTDIRFYNLFYDIPATCYGPYGENAHGANEWVSLSSVKDATKTFAAFILDWCKVRDL